MRGLVAKYDRPAPRYTSYPTAPHFRPATGKNDHAEILRQLPPDQSVSVYIHIPFCRHLCLYCGCHTKVVDHDTPIRNYMQLLQQEILLAARALGRRQHVSRIHFGGGTPNFAQRQDLSETLDMLRREFSLADDAEIAMEMDPRLLDRRAAEELVGIGITRVSLGVQDFQPDVQQAVRRLQTFEHIQNCVSWLRQAGIKGLNFDMIYGLPLQTPDKMRDNMQKLQALRPDRVALFGYAHVPWFKPHQKQLESHRLPDRFERFEMAGTARACLMDMGYRPVGIDHFALPGDPLAQALQERRLHRNFQGYTDDGAETLLAFGQTSISQYHAAYIQNTGSPRDYRGRVLGGELPAAKICLLSAEDIFRRAAIESVMCYGEVSLAALPDAGRWAEAVWETASAALAEMEKDDLVILGRGDALVTARGRPFTRLVASAFDVYMQQEQKGPRHAQAV